MSKPSNEELNQAAMQMIMLAGDGRNLLSEAMNDTVNGCPCETVDEKLKQAREKLNSAHHIQTGIIQSTLEEEGAITTLLFSHAQDTLMTIHSEQNLIGHMIRMYRKLTAE